MTNYRTDLVTEYLTRYINESDKGDQFHAMTAGLERLNNEITPLYREYNAIKNNPKADQGRVTFLKKEIDRLNKQIAGMGSSRDNTLVSLGIKEKKPPGQETQPSPTQTRTPAAPPASKTPKVQPPTDNPWYRNPNLIKAGKVGAGIGVGALAGYGAWKLYKYWKARKETASTPQQKQRAEVQMAKAKAKAQQQSGKTRAPKKA